MIIRTLDVETSGMPPEAGVVEIGWCDVTQDADGKWSVGCPFSELVNPGCRIEPEASAVHHLVDDDVKDAPTIGQVIKAHDILRDDIDLYCAHNSRFEEQFIGIGNAKWIDTYRVALRLAPAFPSHSNQALRYRLKLEVDPVLAYPPHRAGPDSYITAVLLVRALAKMQVAEMVLLSSQPAVLPRLGFGKWAKVPLAEVEGSYLEWILKQPRGEGGFSEDVLHTAFTELQRRRVADKGAA
jgi:exodeoxyribonuclease X